MTDKEKLEEVSRCCDGAFDLLKEIRSKIEQIIEFKKKNPTGGGDELLRRQVGAYLIALENLTKINSGVGSAAEEVKQLCAQAHLLLSKGAVARKGIGIGLGGAATTDEEDEDDDGSR